MDQATHSKQADSGQRTAGIRRSVPREVMTADVRQRNESIRQVEREKGEYALSQFQSLNEKATAGDL